jgi:ADP-ribose pyrophosphatase
MTEQRQASETVFDGRLIQVRRDTVRLENGRLTTREIVEHPGAVGILPVTDTGRIVLVSQYRYAIGRALLEIPAGTREPGEPEEATALRELHEETGYLAGRLDELMRFYTSPGWANEEIILFRASALVRSSPVPGPDEILDVAEVAPRDIPGLMRDGSIADAKTIAALMFHLGTVS